MIFSFTAKIPFAFYWLCSLLIGFPLDQLLANPSHSISSHSILRYDQPVIDPIKVRESTTELHVQVGDKLFVFGKSKGTLDKVKIGMHVLPFAQVPGAEGLDGTFKTVTWKKLKDGSIQIQSIYNPWPATLTWTVLASGQLKMVATGNMDLSSVASVGLGFDLPNHELKTLNWNTQGQSAGVWNGHQDGGGKPDPIFLQGIEKVSLSFESVGLAIRSDTPNLILKLADLEAQSSGESKPDLSFLFLGTDSPSVGSDPDFPSGSSEQTPKKTSLGISPIILWFDFH
jgi:hypothetical protein